MRAFEDASELRAYLGDEKFTEWRAVLGEGDADPDVVVVKKNPSPYDVKAGKPLMGDDGIPIRRALLRRGVSLYATNAFPFFRGGMKPKKRDAQKAAGALSEELRRVDAKRFLLLGANAARWTPGFDVPFRRFKEVEGVTHNVEGRLYRVVHAPMGLARDPNLYRAFLDAVDSLMSTESIDSPDPVESGVYRALTNRTQILQALEATHTHKTALDLETTGLDPYRDRILTVSLSTTPGSGFTAPWEALSADEWREHLGGRAFITQNGQFDLKFLAQRGIYARIAEDAMLMHSLINETPGTHGMERMARVELGIEKWSDIVDYDRLKYGLSGHPWADDPEDVDMRQSYRDVARYGARDTDITLRLANTFRPKVEGRVMHDVLTRAQNALIRSELRGVRIDREKALRWRDEIDTAMFDRREAMRERYNLQNPNSVPQVKKLLYEDLGVPEQKFKGKLTTRSASIEPLAERYPVIHDILEYRHLGKASGTYLKRILESSPDGRYHPEIRLAATETGRVAEKLITLIPRPDELDNPDLGKQYQVKLRELFIPDPGMLMIGADYSGLEVGMAAHLSRDEQLIEDYNEGRDTHSIVAINAFDLDIPLEPFDTLKARTKAKADFERQQAKSGTFTYLFGGSAAAISFQLGIPMNTAQRILDSLQERYPGLARFQEHIRRSAKENNVLFTPWGRPRHFMFGRGMSAKAERDQLREAINFPIQSMATDMNLAAFAELEALGLQTLFPFHDATYVQAPEREVQETKRIMRRVMTNVLSSPVKWKVDIKAGKNWAALG